MKKLVNYVTVTLCIPFLPLLSPSPEREENLLSSLSPPSPLEVGPLIAARGSGGAH